MSDDLNNGNYSDLAPINGNQESAVVDISLHRKESEQLKLDDEIAVFLGGGGKISHIDSNVTASPPKKPESNYGGQLK
ncbi:MAG: hypothetical protein COA42_02245 [Alteromonadaceae bacterium]|nr:MAG: hypothetical protein COA42_02245 [Alteromonadaceae bacterium]